LTPGILDQLDTIEASLPGLVGRLDRTRIAAAGHSWGGQSVQMLLGARVLDANGQPGEDRSDARIRAGATRVQVDARSLAYYGKAAMEPPAQAAAVRKLSAEHPGVQVVTLVRSREHGPAVTLSSYYAGIRAGCSSSGRYLQLMDHTATWLAPGAPVAYRLSTTADPVPIEATADALAAATTEFGGRSQMGVVTHPMPGQHCPDEVAAQIAAHPDLLVTRGRATSASSTNPGFGLALSFAAFANLRLAGYLAGARHRAPYRWTVLDQILEACDDPRASTAALLHAAYLSAAGMTPPAAEHDALSALAEATTASGRRAAVMAVHDVLSAMAASGELEWSAGIYAVHAALSAQPGRE
jgi:hypothetical protein